MKHFSRWALRGHFLAAVLIGLALVSCDERESPLSTEAPHSAVIDSWPERLARGIASALRDPALRQQILVDLRDSPFKGHQIHLSSYLHGARGRALAAAAARALDMKVEDLLARVRMLKGYSLRVPSVLHRARWTGDADVVVAGTSATDTERKKIETLTGYMPEGRVVSIPTYERLQRTLLLIAPSEVDFGPTPEKVRAAAPVDTRATIGALAPLPPESAIRGGFHGGGSHARIAPEITPTPRFTHNGRGHVDDSVIGCTLESLHNTTADNDYDRDGLADSCEYELAYYFRPILTHHAVEDCAGREPQWTVDENPDGWIVAAYLLSYYLDCGVGGHYGDSEFVIAWLYESGGVWELYYLTTSAHWNTDADETELSHWDELDYNADGHPFVYIANQKHANYPNIRICELQHPSDDCDGIYQGHVTPTSIVSGNNLGTYEYRFDIDSSLTGDNDCTASEETGSTYAECYFSQNYFAGWSGNSTDAAGGYIEMLEAYDIAHATESYSSGDGGGGDGGGGYGGSDCPGTKIYC